MTLQAERLHSRLLSEGMPVVTVPTNPQPSAGMRFLQHVPVLRTLARELQYLLSLRRLFARRIAVIHHLSASGLYFFLHSVPVLVLGRLAGKRVILNYRGGRAADFLRSWKWFVTPFMRLAYQVAVPSEFLQRIFAGYGLTSVLLPNIAEQDLFSFRERKSFSPRLLVTRNLEPMYNVECILRAFRLVQNYFPQAVLGIVGSGSEDARLRQMASDWRLHGVTFYGAVRNQDLPIIYAQHDIYVNASSVDNFPGALVEAACSGLPIVTTRAGGIPDMLPDRERAILVPLNDHEALALGVLECLRNAQLAHKLAVSARDWAQQFSWAHVFPRLMDCYGIAHSPLPARQPDESVSVLQSSEVR
jgi:glycosyltransferase involved in cell wall biosynthesis